ncbi:preprotein translocase subunit SecE [Candidatus Margulisiibacteriota bacterium]
MALVKEKTKKKIDTKLKVNNKKQERVGIKRFINDTQAEMRRVTWPKKKEVMDATGIILMIVIFLTVFVSVVDVSFSRILFLLKQIMV